MAKPNARLMTAADLSVLGKGSAPDELDYWSKEKIADSFLLASSRCYVLESATGKLLGHAIFQYVLDEASLLNIAINKEYGRLGYGRQLLLSSMHELGAEGVRRLLLEVRCSNESAIALYETLGFIKDGVRNNYYPSGNGYEDALLMSINMEGDLA